MQPSQGTKPTQRTWEVNFHEGTAFITFKKQPILLNMIIYGLFAGFFTGIFTFAFTQNIIVATVIAICAVYSGAMYGRRIAKNMNANSDEYKPLLEKTRWGYIQRDAIAARLWSKKPK